MKKKRKVKKFKLSLSSFLYLDESPRSLALLYSVSGLSLCSILDTKLSDTEFCVQL